MLETRFYSGWLAPHSLQNFATIRMTTLQFYHVLVSIPPERRFPLELCIDLA